MKEWKDGLRVKEKRWIKGPLHVKADSLGLKGGGFTACLVFGCFGVLCLPFLFAPGKLLHHTQTQTLSIHTCMHTLGPPPEPGAEKWAEKGIHSLCAELFNLWVIIIWPHKSRGWGNSSVGLDCNLLCFSFPCRPMSGRSRDLTGVLFACASNVGLHCWRCCITWREGVHSLNWSKATRV